MIKEDLANQALGFIRVAQMYSRKGPKTALSLYKVRVEKEHKDALYRITNCIDLNVTVEKCVKMALYCSPIGARGTHIPRATVTLQLYAFCAVRTTRQRNVLSIRGPRESREICRLKRRRTYQEAIGAY